MIVIHGRQQRLCTAPQQIINDKLCATPSLRSLAYYKASLAAEDFVDLIVVGVSVVHSNDAIVSFARSLSPPTQLPQPVDRTTRVPHPVLPGCFACCGSRNGSPILGDVDVQVK